MTSKIYGLKTIHKFLFQNPPHLFAFCIALPIASITLGYNYLGEEVNILILSLTAIEGCIIFHVITLVLEISPKRQYLYVEIFETDEVSESKVIPHDCDDIELAHLQQWQEFGRKKNIPEITELFGRLIDSYIFDQRVQSLEKPDIDDDNDGDILV
ncbi:MAG: hypothetical protein MRY57_04140 [Candidatus Pacebacteria bacterium]|nr:hypothetical protein [Candidatus Paceibacterota bacterium]